MNLPASSLTIENLKNLKSKLDNRQMSVLVGAGFSKNIHKMFPSWWELLFDMAYFLKGKEIEKEYERIPVKKRIGKKKFIDDAISDFIDDIGYLDLVTKYVMRKGFQESISTYIEEKTPKILERDGKRYLVNNVRGNNNEIELLDSMLDLHSALINLPWNNIFTTNYDEMLELANDKTNEDKLLLIQETIELMNKELDAELIQVNGNKTKLEEELAILEEKEKASVVSNSEGMSSTVMHSSSFEIQEKRGQVKNDEYNIVRIESSIKNNNIELFKVQKEIEKCLKTVVHSSDLAIKRNRNIIKLHGSIRKDTDPYGFDNDIRSHYVISKEDYELYPQKHEAFTQLMRISLLQESYCLIGFSGVDPNFLEWIKWVRDVLERNKERTKNYKIYLIDVGSNFGKDEKDLFYENFRICKVTLDDPVIIQFLQSETGLILDNSIDRKKGLLSLFLSYLKEENFETPNLFIQQYNVSKYTNEWNSVSTYNLHTTIVSEIDVIVDNILKHYEIIIENKNCSRIKRNDFVFSRSKMSLLQYSIKLLNDLKSDALRQRKIFDLILIAIQDLMLPLEGFWDEDQIKILEKHLTAQEDVDKFNSFKLRGLLLYYSPAAFLDLLQKLKHNTDVFRYEKALFYAFSLDFKKMKIELDLWNPSVAEYILKKSGLLALLDSQQANDYLLSYKTFFEKSNIEDLLFYYQFLIYFDTDRDYISRKKTNSYISILEAKGFTGINKHFNSILNDLKVKPEKIDRYGSGRFSLSNPVVISKDITKRGKSIQFIELLIELGLPIKAGFYNLRSAEEWYEVCKNIFEEFPVPCLYYSLQFSSEKAIRRIAQDYAYSEELKQFNEHLMPELLDKYSKDDLPWSFKKSILYFCSELFVAVDPKIWENKFLSIWKNIKFQTQSFDDRSSEEYIFVIEAIKCIGSKSIFNSIILSCLNNFEKNNSIDFLYYIVNNDSFENVNIQTKEIKDRMNDLMPHIRKNENLIFVFGNLNLKLTPIQQKSVKDQLKSFDFKSVKNPSAWRILYYFSKEDHLKRFKNGLLKSNLLFNTGFNSETSLSMGRNYVSLSFLHNDNIWTKAESKLIYNIIVEELKKIESWMSKRTDTNFEFMFREMLFFLENEHKLLKEIKGTEELKGKISSYLINEIGYSTISEAIASNDKTKILMALSDLSTIIDQTKNTEEIKESLQLLLTRVLFENETALEATLNYIAVWIIEKSNKEIFLSFKNLIKLILLKYSKNYPSNTSIPFIQKQLIVIAESYLKYLDNDADISQCIVVLKKRKFFN